MPKIIISYRRLDSQDITMRIRDRLTARYGTKAVFTDIDSIPLGVDFVEHINDHLATCNAVVAIVGPRWLDAGRPPGEGIASEADFVRMEVEAALDRKLPVIPVLVGGAQMPKPAELPEAVRMFAYRAGTNVDSGENFHNDVDRLIRSLDRTLPHKSRVRIAPIAIAVSIMIALLVLAVRTFDWVVVTRPSSSPELAAPPPSPATTTVAKSPAQVPAQPAPPASTPATEVAGPKPVRTVTIRDGLPVPLIREFVPYRDPQGSFRFDAPKGWVPDEKGDAGQSHIVSVFLRGRETATGTDTPIDVAMSVTKLPRRPEQFASKEEYQRFRRSALLQIDALFGPPDPELKEPLRSLIAKDPRDITLAGIAGKTYHRDYDVTDPKNPSAKPLPVSVEDVVLRTPEFYYVLEYRARRDLFEQYYFAAERLKSSFVPGPT